MKVSIAIAVLMLLQSACAAFLLWDILATLLGLSYTPISWAIYELIEIGAIAGLVLGMCVSASMLFRAQRRQRQIEDHMRLASGAFMDFLEDRFADWALTPAERDVALFAIKGMNTAEIADLRKTSEGTVKAQTNAIYRKAGVAGRPQLLSLFIDALIEGPVHPVA